MRQRNRATLFLLIAFFLSGCATSAVQSNPQSTATVQIVSIVPPAGSTVNADTTLVAELDYAIENFDSSAHYYVTPQFDSTEGAGRTFNAFTGPTSGSRLRSASGRLRIAHPIRPEWSHPWLAKPVRVTFFVTLRTGPQRTKVIGKSETVRFAPVASP